MAEVAEAWVSLLPSAKNWGSQVDRQVGPQLDKAGKSTGSRFSGVLTGFLSKGLKTGGLAVGAVLGTALFKGFERLSAIDQAQAKLKGLGNSTKTVSKIMDNALAAVQGTAFGLGDAATVAASAVAAGIKPGKQLTGVLKTIADTATIAGASMADTGAIFGSVAARGKLQGDDLMQLQSRGVPVLAFLAKHYGITAAAASTMVTKGQVDFKNFAAAMKEGLGGSALKSGNTFKGALANMQAALGRFGAGLLKGAFPIAKKVFASITGYLDDVTAHIGPAQQAVEDFFTKGAGHGPTVVAIGAIKDAAGKIGDGFQSSIVKLDQFKKKVGTLDLNNLDGKKIGTALSTAASVAVSGIGKLGVKITAGFGSMLKSIDWIGIGIKAGPAVIGLVLGLATGIINGIADPDLWKGIWAHLPDILLALAAVAFAPSKIAGPFAKILGRIPIAGKFLEFIVNGLQAIGGKVTEAAAGLLRYFWKGFTEAPLGPAGSLVARILGFLGSIPGKIADFLGLLKVHIGVWALDAFESIGRGARAAVPATLKFVASIPGKILKAVGSLIRLLSPRGADAIDGLLSGIRSKIGSVTKYAGSIPSKVLGAIKGAGKLLKNVGGSIVAGLLQGLKDSWHNVTGWLGDKIAGLSKAAKKLLHINSPSKVFAEIGSSIGEGMALGIKQSSDMPMKSVRDMSNALSKSVRVPASSRFSGGSSSTVTAASTGGVTRADLDYIADRIAASSQRVADGTVRTVQRSAAGTRQTVGVTR